MSDKTTVEDAKRAAFDLYERVPHVGYCEPVAMIRALDALIEAVRAERAGTPR